jgi:RNA polymerase sigma factor (sigma-70 family)
MTTLLENYTQTRTDDAFRALITQYIHLVYSACLRQLRDAHLAEDATQAVFILLHKRAHALPPDRVSSWLLTASRFTCANIRKTERRRARREQEVAVLHPSTAPQTDAQNEEILRLLDQALAHINSTDREAIALHYLQNQPYAAVGATLGLSEEAARKRAARGLDKLRAYFTRHGIPATSAALATLLPSQAHAAALLPSVVDTFTQSILHTCHSGAAAPALAIAKGTQLMMLTHTLKTVAVPTLLVAAVLAAGWWGLARSTQAQPVPPVAAAPAITTPLDLSTPENALASYCAALKNGDRAGVYACVSGSAFNPASAGDAVMSLMLAQNRLILAAAHTFHTDGHEARLFPTIDQVLSQVVAYDRATHQTATIDGNSATLPFQLSDAQLQSFPEAIQPEIKAFIDHPMHFVKEGDQWKLRHSPESSSEVTITLLDKNNQPVTDPETKIEVIQDYAAVFDRLTADITAGQYSTWDDAAPAFKADKSDMHKKHNLSDIEIEFTPPQNAKTSH